MASDLSLDVERLQAALAHWLSHESQRGIFVTDPEFRLVIWNQWMELHSGRPSSEVLGRSLFDLYPEAATRGIREYYEGALGGAVNVLSHALPPLPARLAADQSRPRRRRDAAERAHRAVEPRWCGRRHDHGHRRCERSTGDRERAAQADRGAAPGPRDRGAGTARQGRIPLHAVARDADPAQRGARLGAHPARSADDRSCARAARPAGHRAQCDGAGQDDRRHARHGAHRQRQAAAGDEDGRFRQHRPRRQWT